MPQSTIEIRTHFMFMQTAMRGHKPQISIDGGEPHSTKFGDTSYPVEPGEHTVFIEVLYVLNKRVGKATTTVNVGDGETVRLKYRPPMLVFMKGKIKGGGR